MKRFFDLFKSFEKVELNACIFMLALMSFIVILQVFSRYLFKYSFVWAEELVRYLMIWMVMIGAALVESKNDHIRIDFFPMLAGPRGRRIMEMLFRLCTLLFLSILTLRGIKIANFNKLFESPGLGITMFWPTLALPVGAVIMGIYTGRALIRDIFRLIFWPPEKLREEDDRLILERYQSDPAQHEEDSPQGS